MSVVAQSVGLQKNEGAARMQGMHNAEKNKNYIICQCHEFGRHIALFKGETGAILGRMKSGSIQDLAVRLCCRNFDCVHPAACTLFLVSALRQRAIFREILEAELKTRGRKEGRKEGKNNTVDGGDDYDDVKIFKVATTTNFFYCHVVSPLDCLILASVESAARADLTGAASALPCRLLY